MNVGSGATLRADIADCLKENRYGEGDLIGLKIMPILGVERKSGNFAKIDFTEQDTAAATKRAPGTNYNRQIRETTSDSYTCQEYGREEAIDDGEAEDLGNYFDAEVDAAMSARGIINTEQESRIQAIIQDITTSFLSYKTAVGTAWSTPASCTPVADVHNAINKIKQQINGGLMGARIEAACHGDIVSDLLNSTDIKNRIASTTLATARRDVQVAALAECMGLDAIHESMIQWGGSDVWDSDLFGIYCVPPEGMNLKSVPQVGRSFLWTADCPENALVESYRDDAARSNIIRVRSHVDEKLLSARAGHILTGVD